MGTTAISPSEGLYAYKRLDLLIAACNRLGADCGSLELAPKRDNCAPSLAGRSSFSGTSRTRFCGMNTLAAGRFYLPPRKILAWPL